MEKAVLTSIKPEFSRSIFALDKMWEFRRAPPTIDPPYDIIVYETEPTGELVGEFTVSKIVRDNIEVLIKVADLEGVEAQSVRDYFGRKREGAALKIEDPKEYGPFDCIPMNGERPPQNFKYVDKSDYVVTV